MMKKYKKLHKPRVIYSPITRCSLLEYGRYGIKILSSLKMTKVQIECVRKTLKRFFKKTATLWQIVKPSIPITRKPLEVRMGGGKGPVSEHVALLRSGTIIFEFDGPFITSKTVDEISAILAYKLPVPIQIVGVVF